MPNTVTQNQQASASVINTALKSISDMGQSALNTILAFKQLNLLEYQNIQSYINSRRVLANRYLGAGVLANISAADFSCINQGLTTGSIRADSGIVTCKETLVTVNTISSFKFTSSAGSVVSLDSKGQLYTVLSNSVPTGQFLVQLEQSVDCSIINFDMLANPNGSTITISTSSDNITYTQLTNVAVSGYRVTGTGSAPNTNYIKIQIIPAAPDILTGQSYSFGLTSFTVRASQFALQSEFDSRMLTVAPTTANLYLGGTPVSGLTYYLSINSGSFGQVTPGTTVPIPGASFVTVEVGATVISSQNILSTTLPSVYYLSSLKVKELVAGVLINKIVLPGLSSTDPNLSKITEDCLFVQGSQLVLLTATALTGRIFQVSYYTGPQEISLQLKVIMNTNTYGSTPTFNNLYFEAI